MGGIRRIHLLGLIVAATAFGLGASSASADISIKADPECCTFVGSPFTIAPGESATFNNPVESDFVAHNVTSDASGPDGFALFESPTIQGGKSSPVSGVEYLTAGTYPFVCTLHFGMNGDLIVDGAGTPVARPSVSLAILGQRVAQVKRSGKVRIKARGITVSKNVVVNLQRGKTRFAAPVRLNLKAGQSKVVAVKLNAAGRKAVKRLKRGRKLPLSLSSTVRYGKKSRTNRTLR